MHEPSAHEAFPCSGPTAIAAVSGSPSGSLSLASTGMPVPGSSSGTVAESSAATGWPFATSTWTWWVTESVTAPSETVSVIS